MSLNLRKRKHISYYEPEEPSFDEYIYCERCADFVYDYCAIHGPLLVVPDDEVPVKSNMPSYVPRAALTIPHVFLHLAPSIIPGAGLGVFSTLTLPRGVRFGPYRGQRKQIVDSVYCWQIFDDTKKRSYVVDAADGDRSNWMRFVNCPRHWKEQNLLAYQYKGQLYYRTIKIIPRHTELMVFYGSEFANALHINLGQYNSPKYYKEIISTPKSLKDVVLQDEYLSADQFHLIDNNLDEDVIRKNSTQMMKQNNILVTKTDVRPLKGIPRSKNKTIQDSTEEIRYECKVCQMTFAKTKILKRHELQHLATWKFNCEYCAFKSNQGYRFKQHVGKHTNTYEYSCGTCSFKTNYKRSLERHRFGYEHKGQTHENSTEVKTIRECSSNFASPRTCEICEFKSDSRKAFNTHMSIHKAKIYKCNGCSYSSYRKYHLSRHVVSFRH